MVRYSTALVLLFLLGCAHNRGGLMYERQAWEDYARREKIEQPSELELGNGEKRVLPHYYRSCPICSLLFEQYVRDYAESHGPAIPGQPYAPMSQYVIERTRQHDAATTDQVVALLKEASAGLRYQSETDSPFEVLQVKHEGLMMEKADLLALLGKRAETKIERASVTEFFRIATKDEPWHGEKEKADVKKFKRLVGEIEKHLLSATVYLVGEVEIEAYVVGHTAAGDWVLLKTKVVRT